MSTTPVLRRSARKSIGKSNYLDNYVKYSPPISQRKSTNKRSVVKKVTDKSIQSNKTPAKVKEDDIITTGIDSLKFFNYVKEQEYLCNTIETLLKHSQASSLIICGDSGSGKSTLVDYCFDKFPVIYGERDSKYKNLDVVLFRFDGNLHGKNDLATIRMIGRKLNQFLEKSLQINLDDDEKDETPADDEMDDDEDEDDAKQSKQSNLLNKVANSIPKVVAQFHYLVANQPSFRSIIVLDNIEIFCRRQQTLLYNLLDLTQHTRSILLIGLTRRLDFIDLLEKRVRSRLTQRIIHLISPFNDLKQFQDYCDFLAKSTRFGKGSLWVKIKGNLPEFRKEIEKCFHNNRNFNGIQRMIQEYSFVPTKKMANMEMETNGRTSNIVDSSVFIHKDPKIVNTFNLTRNELTLLIVAARQLKHLQLETFTCRQLIDWSLLLARQLKSLHMNQVIKAVYKMIELDLMIISTNQMNRRGHYSITPWMNLSLNISDFQLKEMLDGLGSKVPSYLRQLLN